MYVSLLLLVFIHNGTVSSLLGKEKNCCYPSSFKRCFHNCECVSLSVCVCVCVHMCTYVCEHLCVFGKIGDERNLAIWRQFHEVNRQITFHQYCRHNCTLHYTYNTIFKSRQNLISQFIDKIAQRF